MTRHTHFIYEVVMTEEERRDEVPDGLVGDHGGLERFEVSVITHTHEIFDDPHEPSHSHMTDPLKTGSYIEAGQ